MGALDNITWKGLSQDLWLKARRECIPINGLFELTPLCNFRCRMCYVRLDPADMVKHGRIRSADEWLDLARQAMEMGAYGITLSGGEPLTHPEFEKIYAGLCDMGLLVTVLTNGSLIDEKIIRLFSEHLPDRVRITLYGASNETYERLCGVHGGFDRVMQSIEMLDAANIPFSFSFTETTENVADVDAVKQIAQRYDVPIIAAEDLNPAVRGATSEAEILRVAPEDRPIFEGDGSYRLVEHDETTLKAAKEGLLTGLFSQCRAYRTYFFVDWNGFMENCGTFSYCRSEPFKVGFRAAWEDMLHRLSTLEEPQKCVSCPDRGFCRACPGRRCAETGMPDGIPMRYCAEARQQHLMYTRYTSNVEVKE